MEECGVEGRGGVLQWRVRRSLVCGARLSITLVNVNVYYMRDEHISELNALTEFGELAGKDLLVNC
jgi:hypothetical protein